MTRPADPDSSPVGLHRVLEPRGVLPQAATRLDADSGDLAGRGQGRGRACSTSTPPPSASWSPSTTVTATAVRAEVLAIVADRGKMQNPVTGSGGMLVGTVDEVGPDATLDVRGRDSRSPPWCRSA